METRTQKGQLFSIDFLIAVALTVLAIGGLLNYYELSAGQAKEARGQNELNVIALTAGELMLRQNACVLARTPGGTTEFIDQGYKLYNCVNITNFYDIQKSEIMVP